MIIAPIMLLSARTGLVKTLGTIHIVNDGSGTPKRSHYEVKIVGKNKRVLRRARVENWARQSRPIYELVMEALKKAGYR